MGVSSKPTRTVDGLFFGASGLAGNTNLTLFRGHKNEKYLLEICSSTLRNCVGVWSGALYGNPVNLSPRLNLTSVLQCAAQVIQTGVDNPGHPFIYTVGCVAGDEESYDVFAPLLDKVIDGRHGGYAKDQKHPTGQSVCGLNSSAYSRPTYLRSIAFSGEIQFPMFCAKCCIFVFGIRTPKDGITLQKFFSSSKFLPVNSRSFPQ